eukprot:2980116-Prymnesium_polylepis.1
MSTAASSSSCAAGSTGEGRNKPTELSAEKKLQACLRAARMPAGVPMSAGGASGDRGSCTAGTG